MKRTVKLKAPRTCEKAVAKTAALAISAGDMQLKSDVDSVNVGTGMPIRLRWEF